MLCSFGYGNTAVKSDVDNPLNQDGIGETEILVVSFGTSYNDSRIATIGEVEKAVQKAFPKASVRRAFTSQIIIRHVLKRDGEKIDNVEEALERAVNNGVKNLIVQPTHLMHGAEYDELITTLDNYKDKFAVVEIAEPLLGEVGSSEEISNYDKKMVCEAVVKDMAKVAGYKNRVSAEKDGVAFVLMGHGTYHDAKITYTQMAAQMKALGYSNVFIGTVEGDPEETAVENVIEQVRKTGFKKVILRPLMLVAGDHATNDMAGDDDDSWKSMFLATGSFKAVDCQILGLGQLPEVQKIYVAHTNQAIKNSKKKHR
jgi:cobalamin biosynthesis Co2+ chelatase CbiK